jgi:hypothetical protein
MLAGWRRQRPGEAGCAASTGSDLLPAAGVALANLEQLR